MRLDLQISLLFAGLAFSTAAGAPTNEVQVDIHDPAMAREGDTYYLYSSGPGITFYSSKDMKHWERRGRISRMIRPGRGESPAVSTVTSGRPTLSVTTGSTIYILPYPRRVKTVPPSV